MKTAFVFPGQGAQTPGMGQEYYEYSNTVRLIFEQGSELTGRDLAALCFNAGAEDLNRTENAQPAIFAVSMALCALLREKGINPAAAAGFSLGECTALCASGAFSPEDGFRLVSERGRLMQAASDSGAGAMCAILGLPAERVKALAGGLEAGPVNYNCPGQTVIAGTPDGVGRLAALCKEAGAKRAIPLALSGAFHTKMMAPAAEALRAFAGGLPFRPSDIPVYTNLTGGPLPADTALPGHLALQMQSPVFWQLSVENMIKDGVTRFIEVGPGNTLSRFISKIDSQARIVPLKEVL